MCRAMPVSFVFLARVALRWGQGFEWSKEAKGVWALPTLPELWPKASPSAFVVVVGKRGREGKKMKAVGRGL